ncbi:hypothetical protein AXF42_Ash012886 [Apostasia shenzhenica]|uniref:RST domain-containing protein n=1 Tax=Apostasia shenzhenica TaxID=1088818 RepID=A0A2I0ARI8_9ASPA|nr:hypothetical protein AXF42_Ash012886 [Apostasia shenzhenica]
MHSGADVEALSAALTRDIGGDPSSAGQPPDSGVGNDPFCLINCLDPADWNFISKSVSRGNMPGMNCQGGTPASQQLLEQWRACSQEENAIPKIEHKEEQPFQSFEHHHSQMEQSEHDLHATEKDKKTESHQERCQPLKQDGPSQSEHQLSADKNLTPTAEEEEIEITDKIQALSQNQENAQPSISQHSCSSQQLNVPHSAVPNEAISNVQRPQVSNEASNSGSRSKAMPTIPFHMLIPILRPCLDKDRSLQLQAIFSKLRCNEVTKEDFLRVIRNIVGDKMLRQAAQTLQMQNQEHKSPPHQPHVPVSVLQRESDASFLTPDNGSQMSREVAKRLEEKGMNASDGLNAVNQEREGAMSLYAVNKQPQRSQMPQSFPMYGVTPSSFHSHYPRPSVGAQATSQKSQLQDSRTRQALHAQGIAATQLGSSQVMSMAHTPKYEIHNTASESKKSHGGSLASHPLSQQRAVKLQNFPNKEQRVTPVPSVNHAKQEVTDQASESSGKCQLTAITRSRILFCPAPTSADGTIQISSATPSLASGNSTKTSHKKGFTGQKKSVEALGTSPSPSSKKQKTAGAFHDQSIDQLNDVTAVSGVNLREEEEQLLCAPKEESRASEAARRAVQEEEETLILQRGQLQRKLEKITSKCGVRNIGNDVERCLSMTDGNTGAETEKDREKDKDEMRLKATKVNKEEDDKMRTTAANVAARAAVGGDDMLSKWQLMAEQARQKREGLDSAFQATKTANNKSAPAFRKREHQESERNGTSAFFSGAGKKSSRIQAGMPQIKMPHSISLKDVISALEREPQMAKSAFIYRLFQRKAADTVEQLG